MLAGLCVVDRAASPAARRFPAVNCRFSCSCDSALMRCAGGGAATVATGVDGSLPVPAAPPAAGRHRQGGGMNEDLFRGPAALHLRAAERHFGKLPPSDSRMQAWDNRMHASVRAHSRSASGLMGGPWPDPVPVPIDRRVIWQRLADREGELALWLLLEGVPRTYWRFPARELAELSRFDWDTLCAGRPGSVRGVSFIDARVFDLRGVPPAEAAELYAERPRLSSADQETLDWPMVGFGRPRTLSVVQGEIARHQQGSLLGYLRAGELLGTGVVDGERQNMGAEDWREDITDVTELFAAARMGQWGDVLVRSPLLESPAPSAASRGGRPKTVDADQIEPFLRGLLATNPDLSVIEQNRKLRDAFLSTLGKLSTDYLAKLAAEARERIGGGAPTGHKKGPI